MSFQPIALASISWLPLSEGGREKLPTGDIYAATAKFSEQSDEFFSVLLRRDHRPSKNQDIVNLSRKGIPEIEEYMTLAQRLILYRLSDQCRQRLSDRYCQFVRELMIVLEQKGYMSCRIFSCVDDIEYATFIVNLGPEHQIQLLVSDYDIICTEIRDGRELIKMRIEGVEALDQLQDFVDRLDNTEGTRQVPLCLIYDLDFFTPELVVDKLSPCTKLWITEGLRTVARGEIISVDAELVSQIRSESTSRV